ncbi:FliH/SctL family protein [Rhizobacter sp. P5_C2]
MKHILKDVPMGVPRVALRAAARRHEPSAPAALSMAMPAAAAPAPDALVLQAWREDAERRGFEAGHQQGLEAAQRQSEAELVRLARLRGEIEQAWAQQQRQWVEFATEFAFGVALRVVGSAAVSAAGVAAMAEAALAEARDMTALTLRVHPRDAELVQRLLGPAGGAVQVLPDPVLRAGGCVLEAREGTLDARLDRQMQQLRDGLLAVHRTAGEAPS